jgi:mono/diheme cytochrome c family protein
MKRVLKGPHSAVFTLALLSTPAFADGDLAAGGDLAQRLCARCHAIAGAGPGPAADAPAFSGLARKWPIDHLAEAFAEGIVTRHSDAVRMPEFTLSPEQIDDLLAYLESVQE